MRDDAQMEDDPETDHAPRRWPTVVAIAVTVIATACVLSILLRGRPIQVLYDRWIIHVYPFAMFVVWFGRILLRRRGDHWLGRLFIGFAVLVTIHVAVIALSDAQMVAAGVDTLTGEAFVPAELPRTGAIAFWISSWLWLVWTALGFPILLLRFPDGRLPGPRWRMVLPILGLGLAALIAGHGLATWPTSTYPIRPDSAPLATSLTTGLVLAGGLLVLAGGVAAFASIVVRWREAEGEQRQQIRVVGLATGLLVLSVAALWPWPWLWAASQLAAGMVFFLAYSVAILRYRLHDLDVAVNRTVVGSLLVVAVTGVYVAIVVGIGSLVGRAADHPLLPLIAVGLIAVLFEPTRRRLRRVVDRLLYRRDVDAYEVLSELADQLRDAGGIDAVGGRVTELLVRGTGADRAEITVSAGDTSHTLSATGSAAPEAPVLTEPIVHDGEQLGAVSLFARSIADLAPDAPALLHQVAGTLGTVLRNAHLTAALEARIDELRRSRQRLVTAQDQARRSLERDIHDGAQVRLVALRLQVGIAAQQAAELPDTDETVPLRASLDRLGEEADATIRTLRELSRGLHPPVLETEGIAAALRAGARGLPVDVSVHDQTLDRFAPQIEAAVYFCCLEAVKNAATHAQARIVRVALTVVDGTLRFCVEDDGTGFDPATARDGRGLVNLEDRISGLDGRVTIDTSSGRGTRIAGEVPLQPLVSDR
jgi:two-component system, NarL family, sensor kinase